MHSTTSPSSQRRVGSPTAGTRRSQDVPSWPPLPTAGFRSERWERYRALEREVAELAERLERRERSSSRGDRPRRSAALHAARVERRSENLDPCRGSRSAPSSRSSTRISALGRARHSPDPLRPCGRRERCLPNRRASPAAPGVSLLGARDGSALARRPRHPRRRRSDTARAGHASRRPAQRGRALLQSAERDAGAARRTGRIGPAETTAATIGRPRGYSSVGRAPGSHPGGREFESP